MAIFGPVFCAARVAEDGYNRGGGGLFHFAAAGSGDGAGSFLLVLFQPDAFDDVHSYIITACAAAECDKSATL